MAQLDAFKLANALRQRLADFAIDRGFVRDERLTGICRRLWAGAPESGGLVGDLWVEGAFPAKTGEETLDALAARGQFNAHLAEHLDRRGAVPRHRPLYLHQRDAIPMSRQNSNDSTRPALVVTAGTGAGKTESFLLPMLNDLFNRKAGGASGNGRGGGVKCLILYPMNALVNDQVGRLYDWLKGQTVATLFHFTSETPEDHHAAIREGGHDWEPCRMRTRQEARGWEDHDGRRLPDDGELRRVPDILVTNYSMLEYMLCRPQDAVFFGDGLRTIVLDEAHLYTGTLAAEITLLLRRLMERCGRTPERVLHIATSATIGTGAAGELESFASQLFTKQENLIEVIRGESQSVALGNALPPESEPTADAITSSAWLEGATIVADEEGKPRLAIDTEQCQTLVGSLPLLVDTEAVQAAASEAEDRPAVLLHQALRHAPLVHHAQQILFADGQIGRMPLSTLVEKLFNDGGETAVRAAIALLQMGAAARREVGDYPLLPHRLHLLARPADGLVVCLNRDCSGPDELKLPPLGCVASGFSDHCPDCLSATLSLYRCANCGETALAGIERSFPLSSAMANKFNNNRSLWPVAASSFDDKRPSLFSLRSVNLANARVIDAQGELGGFNADGVTVYPITICPHCSSEKARVDEWRSFALPMALTLSILAESVLAELPPYPAAHNAWLPARGRRLLAFSDSRQEAARLGPRLTLQHELQLVRAALARCTQGDVVNNALINRRQKQAAELKRELDDPNLSSAEKRALQDDLSRLLRQLNEYFVGGGLANWQQILEQQSITYEIIDADTAESHQPSDWIENAQQKWEENHQQVKKQLRLLMARELARPSRREFSIERLGLLEVTYPGLEKVEPPREFLGKLPVEIAEKIAACWQDLMAALCDSLRVDGVITLGSPKDDDEFEFGRTPVGRWCAESSSGKWMTAFIGQRALGEKRTQRRLWFAAEVLRRCGIEDSTRLEKEAREILSLAFKLLCSEAGRSLAWLETDDRQSSNGTAAQALRIVFPQLALRRPPKLFRCERTGHIWPRSVQRCAPEFGCVELKEVSAETLNDDTRFGRLRRELQHSDIFSLALWAEEHSAQLSPQENRRLQELFKVGARNILSSTTTLELGIDIGGLNAVLMSNVPPGKANYLQRAGRAGRRADGSSVVVTYVRPRPFDREVFARFGDYLGRPLRSPRVMLDRQRIARRHVHALLVGDLFQKAYPPGTQVSAMNAFGRMGVFAGVPWPPKWESGAPKPNLIPTKTNWPITADWVDPNKASVGLAEHFLDYLRWIRDFGGATQRERIERLLYGTPLAAWPEGWQGFFDQTMEQLAAVIESWRREYSQLLADWQAVDANATRAWKQGNAIRYQMLALFDLTVIEALADAQFLPRYGFPIGLQKLRVINVDRRGEVGEQVRVREEHQLRLERAGLLALREYVPGSQLLAGGKLVTSHGLMKHWTGATLDNYLGLRGKFATCLNNHFYYEVSTSLAACPVCGKPAAMPSRDLLFPKHGFSTAAWDQPRRSTEVERVGSVERATITFAKRINATDEHKQNYGGIAGLSARYREDGELLVYNHGAVYRKVAGGAESFAGEGLGFAICLKCGYAESESKLGQGREELSKDFIEHAPLDAPKESWICWRGREAPVLRNQTLAARETTDVLMLSFEDAQADLAADEPLVWTLAYALQIAGAKLLELDTRELGAMVAPAGEFGEGWGAVLYDNVPGGAGHVRELLELSKNWLEEALKLLYHSEAHQQRCETACLDCLLTFDSQQAMDRGLLVRRRTHSVLSELLSIGIIPAC